MEVAPEDAALEQVSVDGKSGDESCQQIARKFFCGELKESLRKLSLFM
jgi:hypothetical protein